MNEDQVADWDRFWQATILAGDLRAHAIAEFVRDGATVLDVGCGDGLLLSTLKSLRPAIKELGVDASSVAIEKARGRGVNAVRCDVMAESDRVRAWGAYDYVIMAEILEHMQNAEFLLRLAGSLAREAVLVTVPNAGHLQHRLRLLFGRWPIVGVTWHVKEHIRFWTVKDFLWWAAALGFRLVSLKGVTGSRWGLHRLCPGLFAHCVLYVLQPRQRNGAHL
jgi:methionine biosynthesis protein MetW